MKQSAGILLYRFHNNCLQVFLVHPGGPFWARKDAGAWTIPKGEPMPGEELLAAARRELAEETGFRPNGTCLGLNPVRQKGGNGYTHGHLLPTSIPCCCKATVSRSNGRRVRANINNFRR